MILPSMIDDAVKTNGLCNERIKKGSKRR